MTDSHSTASNKASPRETRRLGPFEFLRPMGSTPYADVFLVKDGPHSRVLRLLSAWLSDDASYRALFERMAPSLVTLDHPNLSRIHEVGVIDNRLYLLSEHINGPSIRRMNRMLNARATITPMTMRRALLQVVHALQVVHEHHYPDGEPIALIYNDPLPGYLFFQLDGGMMLRDPIPWPLPWLNSSRFIVRDRSTDAYRPPEDLEGLDRHVSNDFYVLANSMLIMLDPPPLHATTSRVRKHLSSALERVKAHDLVLGATFDRCLHPNPHMRFQSATELIADILPLTDEELQASEVEVQQFIRETSSHGFKKPEELSSSLRAIQEVQARHERPRNTEPTRRSDYTRRRAQTIDLPIDALPDLKALRDIARLKSAAKDPQRPVSPFDAPPPVGGQGHPEDHGDQPPFEIVDNHSANHLFEHLAHPHADAPPLEELRRIAPDPRVQTLTHIVRELVHRTDASALRKAAQNRISGEPHRAVRTLSAVLDHSPPKLRSAIQLELGFALLEAEQFEAAEEMLLRVKQDAMSPSDQALVLYYLGLAAIARDDRPTADARLRAIPQALHPKFPDISALLAQLA